MILEKLAARLRAVVTFARDVKELKRDEMLARSGAKRIKICPKGARDSLGPLHLAPRPQVMRMACIYALLDRSELIRVEHLRAALAVWRDAAASARFIFGDSLGNPVADRILDASREKEKGLTRDDIRQLFHRHKGSFEIEQALDLLKQAGAARMEQKGDTGGRPAERWFAVERGL